MSILPDSVSLMHLTQLIYQTYGPFSEFSTMNASWQEKTKPDQSDCSCMVERGQHSIQKLFLLFLLHSCVLTQSGIMTHPCFRHNSQAAPRSRTMPYIMTRFLFPVQYRFCYCDPHLRHFDYLGKKFDLVHSTRSAGSAMACYGSHILRSVGASHDSLDGL